jgi:hypothetical protein
MAKLPTECGPSTTGKKQSPVPKTHRCSLNEDLSTLRLSLRIVYQLVHVYLSPSSHERALSTGFMTVSLALFPKSL